MQIVPCKLSRLLQIEFSHRCPMLPFEMIWPHTQFLLLWLQSKTSYKVADSALHGLNSNGSPRAGDHRWWLHGCCENKTIQGAQSQMEFEMQIIGGLMKWSLFLPFLGASVMETRESPRTERCLFRLNTKQKQTYDLSNLEWPYFEFYKWQVEAIPSKWYFIIHTLTKCHKGNKSEKWKRK